MELELLLTGRSCHMLVNKLEAGLDLMCDFTNLPLPPSAL